MTALPERVFAKKRVIPSQGWLGREFYIPDVLAEWVLSSVETLDHSSRQDKPFALDFGGSSGFRAMELARKGVDVLIVDLIGEPDVIATRNKELASENPANGKLELLEVDVRKLGWIELTDVCGERRPSIVTAHQFIHFLKPGELGYFMDLVADTIQDNGIFALSYVHDCGMNAGEGMVQHNKDYVAAMAETLGFQRETEWVKSLNVRQGFRFNQNIPVSQPL